MAMWTKEQLETQDPTERPAAAPAPGGRYVPDEKIEIVRKVATSKEERDRLKAELESEGFTVKVLETSGRPVEGEYYSATLYGEKRETVLVDTAAAAKERQELKRQGRRITVLTKLGFWTIAALVLLGLCLISLPLLRACRALF
jgi:hypothetical protein